MVMYRYIYYLYEPEFCLLWLHRERWIPYISLIREYHTNYYSCIAIESRSCLVIRKQSKPHPRQKKDWWNYLCIWVSDRNSDSLYQLCTWSGERLLSLPDANACTSLIDSKLWSRPHRLKMTLSPSQRWTKSVCMDIGRRNGIIRPDVT